MTTAPVNPCVQADGLDPRVRRTRALLHDAFLALVHEKKFSEITVQDIAERATVNRATFYAHYIDKEDLAASVLRTGLRHAVMRRFTERPAVTRENMLVFAGAVFEYLEEAYKSCPSEAAEVQDSIGSHMQDELYNIILGWLSVNNAYRRWFPGCSKETAATVVAWAIYGRALRWSRGKEEMPASQVCAEIVSVLMPQPVTTAGARA